MSGDCGPRPWQRCTTRTRSKPGAVIVARWPEPWPRPSLGSSPPAARRPAPGRQPSTAVRTMTGGFDVDAWHCMEARDDRVDRRRDRTGRASWRSASYTAVGDIADQEPVHPRISVVGARHLGGALQGVEASPRRTPRCKRRGCAVHLHLVPGRNCRWRCRARVRPGTRPTKADFYAAVVEDGRQSETEEQKSDPGRTPRSRGSNTAATRSPYERRPNYSRSPSAKAYRRRGPRGLVGREVHRDPLEATAPWLRLKKEEVDQRASVMDRERAANVQCNLQHKKAICSRRGEAVGAPGPSSRDRRARRRGARRVGLAEPRLSKPPRRSGDLDVWRMSPQRASRANAARTTKPARRAPPPAGRRSPAPARRRQQQHRHKPNRPSGLGNASPGNAPPAGDETEACPIKTNPLAGTRRRVRATMNEISEDEG